MHGDQAFYDLFVVFPLLLISVIVAEGINFGWQITELNSQAFFLNGLDFKGLLCCRVLDYDDTLALFGLLFENYI